MLEVEFKASLKGISLPGLHDAMETQGFQLQTALRESDTYFSGIDRDFGQTDEALRLRVCADAETGRFLQTVLTYKGPKRDSVSNTRTEHEVSVGSGETAGKLLEALGFRAAFTVEKVRREYALYGVTLWLDTVTGLGDFLELELLAPDRDQWEPAAARLLALLDQLGVPRENLIHRSYLEMLLERT